MSNFGQWPVQVKPNLLGSMLNRPQEGANTIKINPFDQTTKMIEPTSEAKASEASVKQQPRNQGFSSATSNKIGASIMKSKKLDLSMVMQESSDQSKKQMQERGSAN